MWVRTNKQEFGAIFLAHFGRALREVILLWHAVYYIHNAKQMTMRKLFWPSRLADFAVPADTARSAVLEAVRSNCSRTEL